MDLFGYEVTRCPLAGLRHMPPAERLDLDHIIRLAYAKLSGGLNPYPGSYTLRALMLIDRAETEILRVRAEMAKNPEGN